MYVHQAFVKHVLDQFKGSLGEDQIGRLIFEDGPVQLDCDGKTTVCLLILVCLILQNCIDDQAQAESYSQNIDQRNEQIVKRLLRRLGTTKAMIKRLDGLRARCIARIVELTPNLRAGAWLISSICAQQMAIIQLERDNEARAEQLWATSEQLVHWAELLRVCVVLVPIQAEELQQLAERQIQLAEQLQQNAQQQADNAQQQLDETNALLLGAVQTLCHMQPAQDQAGALLKQALGLQSIKESSEYWDMFICAIGVDEFLGDVANRDRNLDVQGDPFLRVLAIRGVFPRLNLNFEAHILQHVMQMPEDGEENILIEEVYHRYFAALSPQLCVFNKDRKHTERSFITELAALQNLRGSIITYLDQHVIFRNPEAINFLSDPQQQGYIDPQQKALLVKMFKSRAYGRNPIETAIMNYRDNRSSREVLAQINQALNDIPGEVPDSLALRLLRLRVSINSDGLNVESQTTGDYRVQAAQALRAYMQQPRHPPLDDAGDTAAHFVYALRLREFYEFVKSLVDEGNIDNITAMNLVDGILAIDPRQDAPESLEQLIHGEDVMEDLAAQPAQGAHAAPDGQGREGEPPLE